MHCTFCSLQYPVGILQCAAYSLQCVEFVCKVECAVFECKIQCAVCSMYCAVLVQEILSTQSSNLEIGQDSKVCCLQLIIVFLGG